MQEFAAAIASGKQAGYIELVHYRLCGILLFQDMRSMYGRGVLFVPGTRCGGVRKASTVWRQVATARGPELGVWIGARHLWRRKQPSITSTVSLSTVSLSTSTTKSDARHERADELR